MTVSCPSIIDRLLVRGRAVIRESHRYYKVYLPAEHNDIWERLHREKRRIDFVVFLSEPINYVDKVLAVNRRLTKESDRYKLYLPKNTATYGGGCARRVRG